MRHQFSRPIFLSQAAFYPGDRATPGTVPQPPDCDGLIFPPHYRESQRHLNMRIWLTLTCLTVAHAQEPAPTPKPAYEVASIKRHNPADPRRTGRLEPSGRLLLVNIPLRELVRMAYRDSSQYGSSGDAQVTGLPTWANSDTFDLDARPPAGPPPSTAQQGEMLRALLTERFQLMAAVEVKDQPVYHLVQGKGIEGKPAFKLSTDQTPFNPNQGAPTGKGVVSNVPGYLLGKGLGLEQVAMYISGWPGRKVLNKTGITGVYDIELRFTPANNMAPLAPGTKLDSGTIMPEGDYPSIFTAIEEQWGLKLESATAPAEVIVVERAERLIEN